MPAERCPACDRLVATPEQLAAQARNGAGDGDVVCYGPNALHLCGPAHRVDWRARALDAERLVAGYRRAAVDVSEALDGERQEPDYDMPGEFAAYAVDRIREEREALAHAQARGAQADAEVSRLLASAGPLMREHVALVRALREEMAAEREARGSTRHLDARRALAALLPTEAADAR